MDFIIAHQSYDASCNFLLLHILNALMTGLDHASYALSEFLWCVVTTAMGIV
jgi:hypothetical protein